MIKKLLLLLIFFCLIFCSFSFSENGISPESKKVIKKSRETKKTRKPKKSKKRKKIKKLKVVKKKDKIEKVKGKGVSAKLKFKGTEEAGFSLVYIKGDVQVKTNIDFEWRRAILGERLAMGDNIKTGPQSEAQVIADNETVILLDGNTDLLLQEVYFDVLTFQSKWIVDVGVGRVFMLVGKLLGDKSKFEIKSGKSIVMPESKSNVVVDAGDYEKGINVVVLKGRAELYNVNKENIKENKTMLSQNQESTVLNGGKPSPPSRMRNALKRYKNKLFEILLREKESSFIKNIRALNKLRRGKERDSRKNKTKKPSVFKRRSSYRIWDYESGE